VQDNEAPVAGGRRSDRHARLDDRTAGRISAIRNFVRPTAEKSEPATSTIRQSRALNAADPRDFVLAGRFAQAAGLAAIGHGLMGR